MKIHHGDALAVLRALPAESFHCCVTLVLSTKLGMFAPCQKSRFGTELIMTGTEKQIKWAEDIKADMNTCLPQVMAYTETIPGGTPELLAQLHGMINCAAERINNSNDSKWIIDNRSEQKGIASCWMTALVKIARTK